MTLDNHLYRAAMMDYATRMNKAILGEQISVKIKCPYCGQILVAHTFSNWGKGYVFAYCHNCQRSGLGAVIEGVS